MDIAKMSTVLSQAQVNQQANLSVMKKIMDTKEIQANEMLSMLEDGGTRQNGVHPHLGGRIDLQV